MKYILEHIKTIFISIYTYVYFPKNVCILNEHRHIINILIGGKNIELTPFDPTITSIDLSKKAVVICEICEIKDEIVLKTSESMYKEYDIVNISIHSLNSV